MSPTTRSSTTRSTMSYSQGPLAYITPSSDQDIDDTTLGKLLDEAHREHADYRNPEGVSVSQSSMSVVFDRTGKPVGERNVDQSIGFGVTQETRTVLTASFLKTPKLRKWSIEQGNLWEKVAQMHRLGPCMMNRQMIIAEYCEKIGHHELQAARAEEERRILQEELWRQQLYFREVHQQSLTEMEELRKFQSSTFDTIARRAHRGPEHFLGIIRKSTRTTK